MKKNMERRLSFILVLAMVLAFVAPFKARAAGDGSVTLENPRAGVTYSLYRVFDLSYNEAAKAYTYTSATKDLENALKVDNIYKALLKYEGTDEAPKYVMRGDRIVIDASKLTNGEINPYDFSKWLFDNVGLLENMNQEKTGLATGNLQWTGLDLGYYMIKSTAGTIVSLDTTDTDATVHEKNPAESDLAFSKKVKGGTAEDFADTTYANIGEEVEFKISFNVHEYANNEYVLTDTLPTGMDYVGSFAVKNDDVDLDNNKYTVDTALDENSRNLKVTFPLKTIQELAKEYRDDTTDSKKPKTITITYKAKLNNSAAMSNDKGVNLNKNEAVLQYDTGEAAVVKAEASVKTTDFNVFKYANTGENQTEGLAGAKFKIYTQPTGGNPLIFTTKTDEDNIYYYEKEDTASAPENGTEITTPDGGQFTIKGLKTGEYYIEETQAPEGFNSLDNRVKLIIADDNGNVSYTAEGGNIEGNTIKILNQGGTKLPSTGGMGRTLIYTLGGIIFFAALVLLISRNRSKGTQNK